MNGHCHVSIFGAIVCDMGEAEGRAVMSNGGKTKSFGLLACCACGVAEWWFLTSGPSPVALTIAGVGLLVLALLFCLACVLIPEEVASAGHRKESFVPLNPNNPKELTF